MTTPQKDGKKNMAKPRRKSNRYATLGLRVLILLIVTLLLSNSARKKLEKVVTSEQFPTAAEQYALLSQEKGSIRALNAMFRGKGESADEQSGSILEKRLASRPEIAKVKLEAAAKSAEDIKQPATELIDINEDLFRGKLLRISDPSRVFVGISGTFQKMIRVHCLRIACLKKMNIIMLQLTIWLRFLLFEK